MFAVIKSHNIAANEHRTAPFFFFFFISLSLQFFFHIFCGVRWLIHWELLWLLIIIAHFCIAVHMHTHILCDIIFNVHTRACDSGSHSPVLCVWECVWMRDIMVWKLRKRFFSMEFVIFFFFTLYALLCISLWHTHDTYARWWARICLICYYARTHTSIVQRVMRFAA